MKDITPTQALQNLYLASRRAPLSADEHDIIKQSAVVLDELIKSLEEKKKNEAK